MAVFSDADTGARHVREADEAVWIGPAPASDSYLNIASLLEAAKAASADAIHPGYGFLSEYAAFASAVEEAGLVWIGPRPETILSMGLKDQAKSIAEAAGVPVLAGYRGEAQDPETLSQAAQEIGYPLLIKAIAGGGGRGIRAVEEANQFLGALESAAREAESAFGDGRVMLEKLVVQPRHIEVQIFGDGRGRAVHLFERDCSLQRRRQKVIEEAPAPDMPDHVRAAMCEAAVKLAEAVDYAGAGTVEFIVDGSKPLDLDTFWFLEMNTRLQVEHPVTEMITGVDLVAWQIAIAQGEDIPLDQSDIRFLGHAIEARICAEDPGDGFRPGAGLVEEFGMLADMDEDWLRWETGFESDDRVPAHYDSMTANLVVWRPDRDTAPQRLVEPLAHTQCVGVTANIGFLRRCALSEAFQNARHHVNWIETEGETLTLAPHAHAQASVLAVSDMLLDTDGSDPWSVKDGWRLNGPSVRRAAVSIGADTAWLDPSQQDVPEDIPPALITDLSPRRFAVTTAGDSVLVEVPDFEADAEALAGGDSVKAPMPGKLLNVQVRAGETVEKGHTLVVMEAMKMEHSLAAPRDGVIETVHVEAGAQIGEGTLLVSLEPV